MDRTRIVLEAKALLAAKWTKTQIAGHLNISTSKLTRMLDAWEQGGEAAVATKHANCGRKAGHELDTREAAVLKSGMLKKNSLRLAVNFLLAHPDCRPETAAALEAVLDRAALRGTAPAWPVWLTRCAVLTDEEKLLFMGPKHYHQGAAPRRNRGCFYTITDPVTGETTSHPLFPNALWESDDESENQPFHWIDPHTGLPIVGRQSLKTGDSYSAALLGATHIGRMGDAYTAVDQADHALALVDQYGMPLAWRLERGPWENNFWNGIALPREWWHDQADAKLRWGGVSSDAGGPIKILRAKESNEKGQIEGSFQHTQNLKAHTSLEIGRFRATFENVEKIMRKARAGHASAMLHLPGISQAAEMTEGVLRAYNQEAKRRQMFGDRRLVPAELYAGAEKRALPAAERWRFFPCKEARVVRDGVLKTTYKGVQYFWSIEGATPQWDWHPFIPTGWPCLLAYHPLHPEWGCQVFSGAHADSPKNPKRIPRGQFLCQLDLQPEAAQFHIGPGNGGNDFTGKKKHIASVRSVTRTAAGVKSGATVRETAADGLGAALHSVTLGRTAEPPQFSTPAARSGPDQTAISEPRAKTPAGATTREPLPPTRGGRAAGGINLSDEQLLDLDELERLEAELRLFV